MIVYYSEMDNTHFEKLQPLSGCMFDNLKYLVRQQIILFVLLSRIL